MAFARVLRCSSFCAWEPTISPTSRGARAPRRLLLTSSLLVPSLPAFAREVSDEEEVPFDTLVEKYKPNHPPVRASSSVAEIALARHLSAIGAKCYVAWWCPACQEQRESFGYQATELAPFLQVSSNNRRRLPQYMLQVIPGFPSWTINGKQYVGAMSLAELATLADFYDFSPNMFQARSEESFAYIWGNP